MGQIMTRRAHRRQERSLLSGGGLPFLSFAVAAVIFWAVWHSKISRQVESSAMETPTTGVMVLGMHRSGTSMLTGLLSNFGYALGAGPDSDLFEAASDNVKGFFENKFIVFQNDVFFEAQNMAWDYNISLFDPDLALEGDLDKNGERGLSFLNNEPSFFGLFNNHPKGVPYLQKDPRMCITLPAWLRMLNNRPAILFTYRHPLEVAESLKRREEKEHEGEAYPLTYGLYLWIVYNTQALRHSERLCRVHTSNNAIFKSPLEELLRIHDELTVKCHVMPPPVARVSQSVVDSFVDPKLQHNSKERKKEEEKLGVLKDFGDNCVAREFESEYEKGSSNREAETSMFLMAMEIYCDLESGKAYRKDYKWPDILHWQRPARIS
mmetsp:Transcript_34530/g.78823  ORF Transcript_34530/g.78823 Transcript_34530/m.78823 type:complete len:379 (+) Transcript_34530:166-1302(+)